MGYPCFRTRSVTHPCVEACNIHCSCRQDVLQMGSCQSNVPRLAQLEGTNPLRQCPFDAGPHIICCFPFRGLLLPSGRLERLVFCAWTQRQFPRITLCTCTRRAAGTAQTAGTCELHVDRRIAPRILGGYPLPTRLALRACHFLSLPINPETRNIVPRVGLGLPTA